MRLLIVPQSACQTSAFAKYSSERLCCCCSPPSPPARENQTMAILQHSMNLHLNTACSGVQADSSISTSGDASEDSSVTSTASLQTSCCLHAHAATRPSRNTLCSTNRALQSEDEEPYLDLRAVQNAIVCNQPLKLQQLLEHIPHESRHPAALGDCKNQTPLALACCHNHPSIIAWLLSRAGGASAHKRDADGNTALIVACGEGHTLIVREILHHWPSKNLANHKGHTALHKACMKGHASVVDILLDRKVRCNLQDKLGRTALMHAVIAGRPDIVFALLDAGAHHDIKDHNEVDALFVARAKQHDTILEMLLARDTAARFGWPSQATLPQLRISAPRSWSASESSDPDEASDSKETSETDCPACESRMDNDHDAGSQTNHSWTREPYWNRSGLAPDDAEPDDEDESPPCQAYEEFCSQFPHAEYHAEDFANGHFDKDLNIWVLKQ